MISSARAVRVIVDGITAGTFVLSLAGQRAAQSLADDMSATGHRVSVALTN